MESCGIINVSNLRYKSIFRLSGNWAFWCLLYGLLCVPCWNIAAQEQQPAGVPSQEEIPEPETALTEIPEPRMMAPEELPQLDSLAAALADPVSRFETLITMIAVERLLEYSAAGGLADIESLEARFMDERAWLERLAGRYRDLPSRGTQLDPAAWFALAELDQHQMVPDLKVSPQGPDDASLTRQLFDRSDERLAAAILPEALQRAEFRSVSLWTRLLETVSVNEVLLAAVTGLYDDWFNSWTAEAPAPDTQTPQDEAFDVIGSAADRLQALVGSTIMSGPVDANAVKALRFDLLLAIPGLEEAVARDATYLLALTAAVDGLNDDKYLAFTESLLWVISDLLLTEYRPLEETAGIEAQVDAEVDAVSGQAVEAVEKLVTGSLPASRIPRLLTEILPTISNAFSGEFSDVDPRLNASLAAVFDVAQYLQSGQAEAYRLASLRRSIGDAMAQVVLQIPEMDYYFDQPVRQRLADEINVCISIAANTDEQGVSKLSREQFDGCMESLVDMSGVLVSKEELSGDPDGPFGSEQLRRELMMPPWQRINFILGYLHDRFPTACVLPAAPLPNPLEWAGMANVITWFARQVPVYFQTPENEALVQRMRQQGLDLLREMNQQVDCISGQGSGINDPIIRGLADYRLALQELVAGIREAELEFRAERLKPGADVVLHGDATQRTAYRTEDLIIGPCNPGRVCEMTGELETTRALIGLFPDPYLIADETGLGSIEICYDNMQWVDRRSVPVRPDDPHVANYFGRLSFDVIGRYRENESVIDVFGSNFISPDEYHYLFAAATEEVLEDSCPTEWVGTKIVTTLSNSNAALVVPDRLTYLASIRSRPSEIVNSNWGRGSEWRDWFVTGLGVTPHEYAADETIYGRVNQHLQTLYQAEQSVIYAALLRPQVRGGGNSDLQLQDLQEELTARKALLRSYIHLFYPGLMIDSDKIRGSLEGYGALLDTAVLRRFREGNVAVASINELGLSRLEQFQSDWNQLPDSMRRTGSIGSSVAHAIIRLNALYYDFFVLPSERPEPTRPADPPG